MNKSNGNTAKKKNRCKRAKLAIGPTPTNLYSVSRLKSVVMFESFRSRLSSWRSIHMHALAQTFLSQLILIASSIDMIWYDAPEHLETSLPERRTACEIEFVLLCQIDAVPIAIRMVKILTQIYTYWFIVDPMVMTCHATPLATEWSATADRFRQTGHCYSWKCLSIGSDDDDGVSVNNTHTHTYSASVTKFRRHIFHLNVLIFLGMVTHHLYVHFYRWWCPNKIKSSVLELLRYWRWRWYEMHKIFP